MPKLDISLTAKANANSDKSELGDDFVVGIYNGYSTEAGGAVKRPGFKIAASGFDTGTMTKLFWWTHKQVAIVAVDTNLYKLTYGLPTLTASKLTTGAAVLQPAQRPTFAVAEISGAPNLFAANGGRIGYTDGVVAYQYIADADAPTQVTHLGYLDGYLIANEAGTNRWHYADVTSGAADPLTWEANSYLSASGDPDNILALMVRNRQIYLFGPKSIEIWEDTGATVSPFGRIDGGYIESGISAPYSIIARPNNMVWLDEKRRVVQFDGKSVVPISQGSYFDKAIQQLESVSDCYAEEIVISGQNFLVFTFPSANATFVYNEKADDWHIWGTWNTSRGAYDRWIANCYCFAEAWNLHLVGCMAGSVPQGAGYLMKLNPDAYDDIVTTIRFEVITGNVNHKTNQQKRSDTLSFRARSARDINATQVSTSKQLHVRWRDDGSPQWSNGRFISLDGSNIMKRIQRSGVYRERQWSFMTTDSVPVHLSNAQEDFSILR